ncbi:MAG: hypothetical protein AAB853_03390, partial [Patescibacteria group bacterium]
MGVPILVAPKRGIRRSGRMPLPVPAKEPSPWPDPRDPSQYDLRRLPKAEREAARRARVEAPLKAVPPKAERMITAELPAQHVTVLRDVAARGAAPPQHDVLISAHPAHFRLLLSSASFLTALGLVA